MQNCVRKLPSVIKKLMNKKVKMQQMQKQHGKQIRDL